MPRPYRVHPQSLIPHPTNPLWTLVPLGGDAGRGIYAIVDTLDAAAVGQYNWSVKKYSHTSYAHTWNGVNTDGKATYVTLHRLVASLAGYGDAASIDHVNNDGLDCRRSNLRAATSRSNSHNQRRRSNNTSGVKGVCWIRNERNGTRKWREDIPGKWRAELRCSPNRYCLGYFDTVDAAHLALCEARIRYHGEFANHGLSANDNARARSNK